MNDLRAARGYLIEEFRRSNVGPGKADEMLLDSPSRTYLCGALHPPEAVIAPEQNDELQDGDADSSLEGIPSLINAMWPSAMGMTFHVRPGAGPIQVHIEAATYEPVEETVTGPGAAEGEKPKPTNELGGMLGALVRERKGAKAATGAATPGGAAPADGAPQETRTSLVWKRQHHSRTLMLPVAGETKELSPFEGAEGPIAHLTLDVRRHPLGASRPTLMTLTLVNRVKTSGEDWTEEERSTFFQPRIEVRAPDGADAEIFVEGPVHAVQQCDPDYFQHLLLYRHARDIATGHGCATAWERPTPEHPTATRVWTEFIPEVTVPGLDYDLFDEGVRGDQARAAVLSVLAGESDPREILVMDNLAGGRDDAWILSALKGLCLAYEGWLSERRKEIPTALAELREGSPREEVRDLAASYNLDVLGREILCRMRAGIQTLCEDAVAFRCFRLACEVMSRQQEMAALVAAGKEGREITRPDELPKPRWRPFQLAFVLLTLNSITKPQAVVPGSQDDGKPRRERDLMDLIWFPTGGGKTEAYLGLTAYTLFHRRLRHGNDPDHGRGVSVITRYTLRLLTTQQFERATRLLCACEEVRIRKKDRRGQKIELGREPLRIGLWIGGSSTPNRFTDIRTGEDIIPGAVTLLQKLQQGQEPESGADLRQIRVCPWCGTAVRPQTMIIRDGQGAVITSSNQASKAAGVRLIVRCGGKLPRPLEGRCLFDRDEGLPVQIIDEEIYENPPAVIIGTVDKFARLIWSGETRSLFGRLPVGATLDPPDLIIQDELHLISGPLGTMVGIFETAIDMLARSPGGPGPKVIGSTATIRRATEQGWGLFRREVRQFPPPALTAGDAFFARTDRKGPGRTYIGIMAPGISGKQLFLRCAGVLLQTAGEIPERLRDPYWTLICYFNSIRELAGANVLTQDDVPNFLQSFVRIRERLGHTEPVRTFALPEELTSRRPSGEIPAILQHLQDTFQSRNAIDLLLATNMISVGVDVDRLGLMLIQGQPKTTAEYIQASSRIGRKYPGLVLTCLNWTRSRDRSHYERFASYHEAFYREVEATSVTPWSSPTRDRGLSAVMVTMLRHLEESLVASPAGLAVLSLERLEELMGPILERVHAQDQLEEAKTTEAVLERLKRWQQWAGMHGANAKYGSGMVWDRGSNCLLRQLTSPGKRRDGLEGAPTSMRSVEPETGFYLRFRPVLAPREDEEATADSESEQDGE